MPRPLPWLLLSTAVLSACSGARSGSGSAQGTLPVIVAFGADPASVAPGSPSTLSWTVEGATAISIDNGVGEVTGRSSVEVRPTATTQYTLSATNADGARTGVTVVQVAGSCGPIAYHFPPGPSFQIPGTTTTASLSRTIPWSPGVPGGGAYRSRICETLSPSGGDDSPLIRAALGRCSDGGVVQLSPGTYRIETTLYFPRDNVTLRGTGGPGTPDSRRARLVHGADAIFGMIQLAHEMFPDFHDVGEDPEHEADLAEPALQGVRTLRLAPGTATHFSPGELVVIDQKTSPGNQTMFAPWSGVADPDSLSWDELIALTRQTYALWPLDLEGDGSLGVAFPYAMWDADYPPGAGGRGLGRRYDRPIAQVVEIESVDAAADTVTLRTPLHFTFVPGLDAKLGGSRQANAEGLGLEDLYIGSEPPSPDNPGRGGISFALARRSWIRNVEFDKTVVRFEGAYQCTLRDSYVHEQHGLPRPSSEHYGVGLDLASSDNLVENNIVWNEDKVSVGRVAGPGNVLAYNYMDDGWIFYQPNWVESGINAAHAATSHYFLFEGNLSFAMGTDSTHGNNIFMTWLRNVATAHRAGWPPLNAYRVQPVDGEMRESNCVPPKGYSDRCVAYSDWGNRSAAQAVFGDYFYSYLGNVLGTDDTPLAPQFDSKFVYASTEDGVPMWDVGRFWFDGMETRVDRNVMSSLWRDGNYDIATGTTRWDGGAQPLPASLYLCAKPAFFGSWTWPWVDGSAGPGSEYVRRPYQYYPLMEGIGTFVTPDLDPGARPTTQYQGYQLPAFARFLKLREIEGKLSDCAGSTVTSPTPECQLLLTGRVP